MKFLTFLALLGVVITIVLLAVKVIGDTYQIFRTVCGWLWKIVTWPFRKH